MKWQYKLQADELARSPSIRREWIEIDGARGQQIDISSPSIRREWIEMCIGGDKMYILDVSLHTEGVD